LNQQMAKLLRQRADEVAVMFSNKSRGGNHAKETFHVQRIEVLSEATACVIFDKTPKNKQAVAWFYYIASKKHARWEYFFVTYSHLIGLDRVGTILHEIEQHNFKLSTGENHGEGQEQEGIDTAAEAAGTG